VEMSFGKILVVGFQPYDAGKTTLCKALIYGLKEAGVNLVPFKPHSGISYWTEFNTFQENVERGSLVCSDVIELEGAANSGFPLEVLNPVNRLSRPVLCRGAPDEKLAFQEFVAERFTHSEGTTYGNVYYWNKLVNVSQLRDMRAFFLKAKRKTERVRFITRFQDLLDAYIENFEKATVSCYRHIKDKPLIIESFNDVAYPFSSTDECDIVICVSSDIVLWCETGMYLKVGETSEGEKSKLQMTFSDVYTPSLIKKKFRIQPLRKEERYDPEKLRRHYSEIIRAITLNK